PVPPTAGDAPAVETPDNRGALRVGCMDRQLLLAGFHVPDEGVAVVIGDAGDTFAVRAERKPSDEETAVAPQDMHLFARVGFPEPNAVVTAARGYQGAIRAELSATNLGGVLLEGQQFRARGHVPDTSRFVLAGGDESISPGVEGHTAQPLGVSLERLRHLPRFQVPPADFPIPTARFPRLAVGAET